MSDDARARLLALLQVHGTSVASFQALEPGLTTRFYEGGAVAFFDTGSAWVAAADPIAPIDRVREIARRFEADARANGRRPSFFCCEQVDALDGKKVALGEQPIWLPAQWESLLAAHRSLREQIRRARAKGVVVRRVDVSELAEGSSIRRDVEAISAAWLGTRPMEPMQFLVCLAPFEEASEHLYWAAERGGELVAFVSAIPIYGRKGLFLEDLIRRPDAPNGTTELLIDTAMRDAKARGLELVTLGLAPLSGEQKRWMRVMRLLGRGLYDFDGVRAFKARLHPDRWEPVWMVCPKDASTRVAMLDALTAFAGGSLVRFGLATLLRRPLVAAWILTLLLGPWTLFLFVLAMFSDLRVLAYDRSDLLLWATFDAIFFAILVRAFLKPRVWSYATLAALAAFDGAQAVHHLATLGLGTSIFTVVLRPLATFAPFAASLALARCAVHVARRP